MIRIVVHRPHVHASVYRSCELNGMQNSWHPNIRPLPTQPSIRIVCVEFTVHFVRNNVDDAFSILYYVSSFYMYWILLKNIMYCVLCALVFMITITLCEHIAHAGFNRKRCCALFCIDAREWRVCEHVLATGILCCLQRNCDCIAWQSNVRGLQSTLCYQYVSVCSHYCVGGWRWNTKMFIKLKWSERCWWYAMANIKNLN